MDCKQVTHDISGWSDGELEPKRIQAMADHIKNCGACHREYRETFALSHRLNALPLAKPSAALRRRTITSFGYLKTSPPLSVWWKYAGTGLRSAALSVAAAGLILGFALAHKALEPTNTSQETTYIIALNETPGGLL